MCFYWLLHSKTVLPSTFGHQGFIPTLPQNTFFITFIFSIIPHNEKFFISTSFYFILFSTPTIVPHSVNTMENLRTKWKKIWRWWGEWKRKRRCNFLSHSAHFCKFFFSTPQRQHMLLSIPFFPSHYCENVVAVCNK